MKKALLMSAGMAALMIAGGAQNAAFAQEKLKIGVVTTLSGPAAVLGQQLRNGLQLAIKDNSDKFLRLASAWVHGPGDW